MLGGYYKWEQTPGKLSVWFLGLRTMALRKIKKLVLICHHCSQRFEKNDCP